MNINKMRSKKKEDEVGEEKDYENHDVISTFPCYIQTSGVSCWCVLYAFVCVSMLPVHRKC